MTIAAKVAFSFIVIFSLGQMFLAATTVWLAQYPVKRQYRGFRYEFYLLFLLAKKHLFFRTPLTKVEFREYDGSREVAKNIFFSLIFFLFAILTLYAATLLASIDPFISFIDCVLLFVSLGLLIVQLRIYDSERRIYSGKVSNIPFSIASEEVLTPPQERFGLNSGLVREADVSSKPIYQRIDRETFVKRVSEYSQSTEELVENDKRQVEEQLKKSKWSEKFEITGVRAKPQK